MFWFGQFQWWISAPRNHQHFKHSSWCGPPVIAAHMRAGYMAGRKRGCFLAADLFVCAVFVGEFSLKASSAKNWTVKQFLLVPALAWGIFFLRSNFVSSSGWHKKLLSSWTMDGTARRFHSLRHTCLRQTPSFKISAFLLFGTVVFKSTLTMKVFNAWTNAPGKSVELRKSDQLN